MRLFYRSMSTGSKFIFEATEERRIVQDLENAFYASMYLEDASCYNEIELISCLLQTLVNGGKLDKALKDYLVGCLRETKKELFEIQVRLQKTEERLETLREKYHDLLNKQKE